MTKRGGQLVYYYKIEDKLLFSNEKYDGLEEVNSEEIIESEDNIYFLGKLEISKSRRSFSVSDPSLLFLKEEGLKLLKKLEIEEYKLPKWLISKINSRKVTYINTEYPNWKDVLYHKHKKKWKVNVIGLGDVGGTLVVGLRLVGGDCISEIGIYGRNESKLKRWDYEVNQILSTFDDVYYPPVKIIEENELFDCDMFVFCASIGVPPVGTEDKDVRMVQFEGNSKLIKSYAKMARRKRFKGIFAVVSDPVDLLCKSAFICSNTNEDGKMDYNGLAPEQIRGYGLGVMHARAVYYASKYKEAAHYMREGRAFGPHGEGLVIADSIENYNDDISVYLTEKTIKANIDVRKTGFKPYIAPAISSGSLSIVATIKQKWHYSATFMGGVFMGARNRQLSSGIELERLNFPEKLYRRIENTYNKLRSIL
ncbi:lactate dehydrogenase [Caminicella sporogenes]|nr:lactate dehydrogenase [Caminicella sporogenes]RKD21638.1 lactate dehydrogenase [Caminicella sporogenes]